MSRRPFTRALSKLSAAALAFALLGSPVVWAKAPSNPGAQKAAVSSPLEVVKDGNAKVKETLAKKDTTVEQLATVVDGFVDFGELAKRALGKEWDKLTPGQRTEFSDTMKGLLRASYAQKAIGQSDAEIRYGKESITGDEATVATMLVVKKDEFPVDYRLYKTSSGWRIYDVVTDEVSLVETYRGQFRKLIADKGFDGLLATLKAKRAQLEKKAGEKVKG